MGEDYDDDSTNGNANAVWGMTTESDNSAWSFVSDTQKVSAPNSYHIDNEFPSGDVWFNFSQDGTITNIDLSIFVLRSGVAPEFYFQFYDSNNVEMSKFGWVFNPDWVVQYGASGNVSSQVFSNGLWNKISMTFESQTVLNVTTYNNADQLTDWIVCGLSEYADNFSYFKVWSTSSQYLDIYIDDVEITTGYIGVNCGDDLSLDYIGEIYGGLFHPITNRYIESEYDINIIDSTFYYLDLDAGITQYTEDSDVTNYYAWLNGVGLGTPTCFFRYDDTYILRWTFTDGVYVNDDNVLLEFYHSELIGQNTYWQVGIGPNSNTDLDGDGDVSFRFDSAADGIYNGENLNWDLSYRLYSNISDVAYFDLYDVTENETFLEVFYYWEECLYKDLDYFHYIGYLNSSDFVGNDALVEIRYFIDDSFFSNSSLFYIGTLSDFDEIIDDYFNKQIDRAGQYRIYIYNGSSDVSNLVYKSNITDVCDMFGNPWDSDSVQSDDVVDPDEDTEFNLLIGILITLGLGIGILIITNESIAMFTSMCVMSYILSLDILDTYQLFPTEVGMGIIVVLVLIAVISWILK